MRRLMFRLARRPGPRPPGFRAGPCRPQFRAGPCEPQFRAGPCRPGCGRAMLVSARGPDALGAFGGLAGRRPDPKTPQPATTPTPAAAAVDPALLEIESQRIAVIDKAKDSVLAVFVSTGQGGGSGVVITPDGYALTNFHVAHECGSAMKCGMADGRLYDAVLVGIDPTGDVALIKLVGRDDFPHAELGDSDQARVGDWVFAMGKPVPAGHRSPAHRHPRHYFRRPPLPVSGGHDPGVRRLPADRRLDQPRQLRRPAVRRPGPADRHQRPRQLREAGPRGGRRRLCDLHQPDQELSRRPARRPAGRSRHPRGRLRFRQRRPRDSQRHRRDLRRLPPRPADGRRAGELRRAARLHPQRIQERAGHLPQGGGCR